jgi:glycosyltransferase involved in cell wall biosynthesis
MRLKILHCVDDAEMGGVNFALQALCHSPLLAKQCDFEVRYLDLTVPTRVRTDADIICFHGASNWRKLIGLICLKLQYPRTPFLLQEHHYSQHFVNEQIVSTKRFYRMLKWTYALMDTVIAISTSQQQWMLTHHLIKPESIALLGQGRDLSAFVPMVSNNLSTPDNITAPRIPIIAAYGRFHHQKGFDVLLQAMANIPVHSCQLILGGEGPQLAQLEALASHLPHVSIVGCINDVPAFLSQCDAVIIPSRWEPFGLVFIEASSMAKWIISTSVDGLGDQLVSHFQRDLGPACITIEHANAEAIQQAIHRFLQQWQTDPPTLTDSETLALWRHTQWQQLQHQWLNMINALM